MAIKTHLIKKTARFQTVCTHCDKQILPTEEYHLEEGLTEHVHSLIARRFCTECYSKHGETKLLTGSNQ